MLLICNVFYFNNLLLDLPMRCIGQYEEEEEEEEEMKAEAKKQN